MLISKRSVLITGALRGLGYELSKFLIKDNKFKLILTSRDSQSAQSIVEKLKAINTQCIVEYHELQIDSHQSVLEFVSWIKQSHQTVDVLVNNAAIKGNQVYNANPEEIAIKVLKTNVSSTIDLTQALLPSLTEDAKIVMVSSNLGKLEMFDESIQQKLGNSDITIQTINEMMSELILARRNGTTAGWNDTRQTGCVIYCASKCLLNAYSRFILSKTLPSTKQTVIVIHPGWVQTDMGGPNGILKPEQGIQSMLKAIQDIPFGESQTYNGIFLNEKGDQWDY